MISLADAAGNLPNTFVVLEKAGSQYVVTFFDSATKHFYTATDSVNTALYFAATPELNALMAQYGIAGNLNTILFTNGNSQFTAPPSTLAGESEEVQFFRRNRPAPAPLPAPAPVPLPTVPPVPVPGNGGILPPTTSRGGFEYRVITPYNDGLLPYRAPYCALVFDGYYVRPGVQVGPVVQGGPIIPGSMPPAIPTQPTTPTPTVFQIYRPSDPFAQPVPGINPRPPVARPIPERNLPPDRPIR